MEENRFWKETAIIFIASLILALAASYLQNSLEIFLTLLVTFIAILSINVLSKKFFANNLETNVEIKFWSWYQFGYRKSQHFKKPLIMAWLPLLISLITKAKLIWMPVIEFDVSPKPERISRRHGLYRYTEVTEWHIALIATIGIFANVVFGVIGYFLGFEQFAKYCIYFAAWNLLPISSLDGTKIFFGSRILYFSSLIIIATVLLWGISIVV